MKVLRNLTLAAGIVILTACATATPYQAATDTDARNGYAETLIENDRALISFSGNSLTDRETVQIYMLYRAAELTKQRDYDHFVLIDRVTDKKTRLQSTGFHHHDYGFFDYRYFHPRYGWSRPYYHPFYYRSAFYGRGFRYSRLHDSFHDHWSHDPPFDVREITRYKASAEVRFGRGPKPASQDNAFNADEVLQNLGPKIVYPERN